MGVVTFTSFANVKKPSLIFFNNENLDQVQCIVQKCIPIKLFNRVLAFPLGPFHHHMYPIIPHSFPPISIKRDSVNKCDILV